MNGYTQLSEPVLGQFTRTQSMSRIRTLPNYSRFNLSTKLEFVIVFQAIEIQRLRSDIQTLQVSIRQMDRHVFNSQNFEIQIKELTEKCFGLELEKDDLAYQLERVKIEWEHLLARFKQVQNDIDNEWQVKWHAEKANSLALEKELESYRSKWQELTVQRETAAQQYFSLIEQRSQLTAKREASDYQVQLTKLQTAYQTEAEQHQLARRDIARIVEEHAIRMKNEQSLITELRSMLQQARNQNENLKQAVRNKNETLGRLESQLNSAKRLGNKNQETLKQMSTNISRFEVERIEIINQNSHFQSVIQSIEQQNRQIPELQQMRDELSLKVMYATREIERLNEVLRAQLGEADHLKKKVEAQRVEIEKNNELGHQLKQQKSINTLLAAENDKLQKILHVRAEQIENVRNQNVEMSAQIETFKLIAVECDQLSYQASLQQRAIEELQKSNSQKDEKLQEASGLKAHLERVEHSNKEAHSEIQKLNGQNISLRQLAGDMESKNWQLETALTNNCYALKSLEEKINLILDENSKLSNLLQSANQFLKEKDKEIIDVRTLLKNSEADFQSFKGQEEQMRLQINNSLNQSQLQLNRLEQQVRKAEAEIKQEKAANARMTYKIERLTETLKEKAGQLEDQALRMREAMNELKSFRQLRTTLSDFQHRYQMATHQLSICARSNEEMQDRFKSQRNEAQIHREAANSNHIMVLKLQSTLQILEKDRQAQISNNEELNAALQTLSFRLNSKDLENERLLTTISLLETKCEEMLVQLRLLLHEQQLKSRETVILQNEIQSYKDYAQRIGILGAQIDRLTDIKTAQQHIIWDLQQKLSSQIHAQDYLQSVFLSKVLMAVEISSLRNKIAVMSAGLSEQAQGGDQQRRPSPPRVQNLNMTPK